MRGGGGGGAGTEFHGALGGGRQLLTDSDVRPSSAPQCHVLICYLLDVNALFGGDGTRCAAPLPPRRGHIRAIIDVER